MMCDFARAALARSRQRLATGAGRTRLMYAEYPNRVQCLVPDEVLRFANENVMVFTALEQLPRRTKVFASPGAKLGTVS
jgi:hypothetical protein